MQRTLQLAFILIMGSVCLAIPNDSAGTHHDNSPAVSRTDAELLVSFEQDAISFGSGLQVRFVGASETPRMEGLRHPSSLGSADTCAQVVYHDLYPGIDLVYYWNEGTLESDYIVQPGTDPSVIRMVYEGASMLSFDRHGALHVDFCDGRLTERAPVAYQVIDGASVEIDVAFALNADASVGFRLASYDKRRPLVIDPQIVFSTYLGGNDTDDNGYAVAIDTQGSTYVTGNTSSTNFLRTVEIPTGTTNGGYVIKYAKDGSLVYATMIYAARASAIDVDTNGCAYLTGTTSGSGLPTTPDAFQTEPSSVSFEAFVLKLDATGHLAYASYLGGAGTDEGEAIAVDDFGYAYVAGWTASTNFPVTTGAYQTTRSTLSDNFITRFTPGGTGVAYSTYANAGQPFGLAVDSNGTAYITGRTGGGIPDVNALQPTYGGGTYDAFILCMNPAGSDLSYATYFGGSSRDEGADIALDPSGNMYLVGSTDSTDLLITNAFQPTYGAGEDAFFAKIDASGDHAVFSTYLGDSSADEGYGIAVDSSNMVYVVGTTTSIDFPVTNALQPAKGSNDFISTFKPDAFVAEFDEAGSNLIYSTYWGGGKTEYAYDMALGEDGSVSVIGYTESVTSFPVVAAVQGTFAGGERDVFVARFPPIDIAPPALGQPATATNGTLSLSWYGQPGWTYDVEYTESLTPPVAWSPLAAYTNLPGLGSPMSASDPASSTSGRVYRVLGK